MLWHDVGLADVDPSQSISEMLRRSESNYRVSTESAYVFNRWGEPQPVPDRYALCLEAPDMTFIPLDVVKSRYRPVQNEAILRQAVKLTEHASTSIDCIGSLDGGRKFFATVNAGTTHAHGDEIKHYVCFMTSHDGSCPIMYYSLDARADNSTTLRTYYDHDSMARKLRHTPNWESQWGDAGDVWSTRMEWTRLLGDTIREWSPVSLHPDDFYVLLDQELITKGVADQRSGHIEHVLRLYDDYAERGCGYGPWAAYNAFCEWVDLHRVVQDRVRQMLEFDNLASSLKRDCFVALDSL